MGWGLAVLGTGRQEKTGWPFLSDTHSPENRVTLGASWSACVSCAVEGQSAVLASADKRPRHSSVSREGACGLEYLQVYKALFQARLDPGTQKMLPNLFLSPGVFSILPCLGFPHAQTAVVSGRSRLTERGQ